MASYVDSILSSGETVKYRASVSIWSLIPLLFIGLILTIVYFGPIFWIIAWIRYKTTELAITNKKIIAKFGFIQRDTIELLLQKVESIQVKQSILGRIFGYGSIIVSGSGNPQAPIPGISNPMEFRRQVMELLESSENPNA